MDRREFQQSTLASLLTWSLLKTVFQSNAIAADIQPVTQKWLTDVNDWSRDLKGKKLDPLQWQSKIEELFATVDLPSFLKFIDLESLAKQVKSDMVGEQSLRAPFPEVEGLPTEMVFGHQVFALNKGRSVVPHGHDNMATAFLILQGEFDGKHYDRIESDAKHMIIEPTIDKTFGPGGCSTVSDLKDNVHWFKAKSDSSFIFNIHVLSVKPGRTGRVYIDPNGEKLAGGKVKARIIDHKEANRLYG